MPCRSTTGSPAPSTRYRVRRPSTRTSLIGGPYRDRLTGPPSVAGSHRSLRVEALHQRPGWVRPVLAYLRILRDQAIGRIQPLLTEPAPGFAASLRAYQPVPAIGPSLRAFPTVPSHRAFHGLSHRTFQPGSAAE